MRALFFLWLAAAQAQTLDLRIPPVTGGTVASIREVGASPKAAPSPTGTQTIGLPSDIQQAAPVGAVASMPFGGYSGPQADKKWTFGAAGTPEMQAQLARSAHEIIVTMDDGERRVFRPRDPSRFRIGQRVSVRAGDIEPLPKDGI